MQDKFCQETFQMTHIVRIVVLSFGLHKHMTYTQYVKRITHTQRGSLAFPNRHTDTNMLFGDANYISCARTFYRFAARSLEMPQRWPSTNWRTATSGNIFVRSARRHSSGKITCKLMKRTAPRSPHKQIHWSTYQFDMLSLPPSPFSVPAQKRTHDDASQQEALRM